MAVWNEVGRLISALLKYSIKIAKKCKFKRRLSCQGLMWKRRKRVTEPCFLLISSMELIYSILFSATLYYNNFRLWRQKCSSRDMITSNETRKSIIYSFTLNLKSFNKFVSALTLPPTLLLRPRDITAVPGNKVLFECYAGGK